MLDVALPFLVCTVTALFSGALLYLAIGRWHRSQSWLTIIGSAVPLATVWVAFIVGSLLQLIPATRELADYYSTLTPGAPAVVAILAFVSMLCYAIVFPTAIKITSGTIRRLAVTERHRFLALGTLLPLLALDWYGRIQAIVSGTYFRHIANSFEGALSVAKSDPVYILITTTGYAVLALLLYLRRTTKPIFRRWILNLLITVQSVFLIAHGSRIEFIYIVAMALLVLLVERGFPFEWGRDVRGWAKRAGMALAVLACLWVGVMAVPIARRSLVASTASDVDHPSRIVRSYLLEELPQQIGNVGSSGMNVNPAKRLIGRIGSYSSFSSSVTDQQLLGKASPIGLDGFLEVTTIAVPSFLGVENKPNPNAVLHSNFSGLSLPDDPHGHPLTSGVIYLGLIGAPVVLVIGAVIAGVYMGLLSPFGRLGVYVAIGLVGTLIPLGTDIGAYLSSLRNGFLVLMVLYAANSLMLMSIRSPS